MVLLVDGLSYGDLVKKSAQEAAAKEHERTEKEREKAEKEQAIAEKAQILAEKEHERTEKEREKAEKEQARTVLQQKERENAALAEELTKLRAAKPPPAAPAEGLLTSAFCFGVLAVVLESFPVTVDQFTFVDPSKWNRVGSTITHIGTAWDSYAYTTPLASVCDYSRYFHLFLVTYRREFGACLTDHLRSSSVYQLLSL
jgi:hypothetical protein